MVRHGDGLPRAFLAKSIVDQVSLGKKCAWLVQYPHSLLVKVKEKSKGKVDNWNVR